MEAEDDGLNAFQLSDSELEADPAEKKKERTGQTEADWQQVKAAYYAKVENGNVRIYCVKDVESLYANDRQIYKSIQLPLSAGANKQHVQEVIHAAEELYFFRRYEECISFLEQVLEGSKEGLGKDAVTTLERYLGRCKERLA